MLLPPISEVRDVLLRPRPHPFSSVFPDIYKKASESVCSEVYGHPVNNWAAQCINIAQLPCLWDLIEVLLADSAVFSGCPLFRVALGVEEEVLVQELKILWS